MLTNVKLAFRTIGAYIYPQHIIVDSTGSEVGIGRSTDTAWNGQITDAGLVSVSKAIYNISKNAIGAEIDTAGNIFHPAKLQRTTSYDRSVVDQISITTTLSGADGQWAKTVVQTFSNGLLDTEVDSGWIKQGS